MQAFEHELLTLLPRLRRFARSLARDAADADDLTQVALERALKARSQWQPGTRLDSWMMKIMRNCWIDETRSRVRRARTFAPEEEGAAVGIDAHHDIERSAAMQDVDKAMDYFPLSSERSLRWSSSKGSPIAKRRRSSTFRSAP